jgi:hypothetical protein
MLSQRGDALADRPDVTCTPMNQAVSSSNFETGVQIVNQACPAAR